MTDISCGDFFTLYLTNDRVDPFYLAGVNPCGNQTSVLNKFDLNNSNSLNDEFSPIGIREIKCGSNFFAILTGKKCLDITNHMLNIALNELYVCGTIGQVHFDVLAEIITPNVEFA